MHLFFPVIILLKTSEGWKHDTKEYMDNVVRSPWSLHKGKAIWPRQYTCILFIFLVVQMPVETTELGENYTNSALFFGAELGIPSPASVK